MLTEKEYDDMGEVIDEYCAWIHQGKECERCEIDKICEKIGGLFGSDYPEDTEAAYNIIVSAKKESCADEYANDAVNHPAHYTYGSIECIDAIKAALSCQTNPYEAWLTGQVMKYIWRWPLKNGVEDLYKARFYLDRLIKEREGQPLV